MSFVFVWLLYLLLICMLNVLLALFVCIFVYLYICMIVFCIYVCICVVLPHNKVEYSFAEICVFVKGIKEGNMFIFLQCQSLLFKSNKPMTGKSHPVCFFFFWHRHTHFVSLKIRLWYFPTEKNSFAVAAIVFVTVSFYGLFILV